MRVLIFVIVKKIMSSNEQVRLFALKIELLSVVRNRVKTLTSSIENTSPIEMNKKCGVQKVFNRNYSYGHDLTDIKFTVPTNY